MTNSYNPIALKPIDYATPLQNVYAEQSAALDRYHAQLRERDKQKEKLCYENGIKLKLNLIHNMHHGRN